MIRRIYRWVFGSKQLRTGEIEQNPSEVFRLVDLSKSYNSSRTIFQRLNLAIPRNKIVAFLGPSGSGKTTLLYLLGGLLVPDDGQIFYCNEPLSPNGDALASFRDSQVRWVFQHIGLLPYLTARENVALPLFLRQGRSWHRSLVPAGKLLEALEFSPKAMDNKPAKLSGGEAQKVGIARAIIEAWVQTNETNKPPHFVLLADEPTGNLDLESSLAVMRSFLAVREDFSASVVMVTHNEELAQRYADFRVRLRAFDPKKPDQDQVELLDETNKINQSNAPEDFQGIA